MLEKWKLKWDQFSKTFCRRNYEVYKHNKGFKKKLLLQAFDFCIFFLFLRPFLMSQQNFFDTTIQSPLKMSVKWHFKQFAYFIYACRYVWTQYKPLLYLPTAHYTSCTYKKSVKIHWYWYLQNSKFLVSTTPSLLYEVMYSPTVAVWGVYDYLCGSIKITKLFKTYFFSSNKIITTNKKFIISIAEWHVWWFIAQKIPTLQAIVRSADVKTSSKIQRTVVAMVLVWQTKLDCWLPQKWVIFNVLVICAEPCTRPAAGSKTSWFKKKKKFDYQNFKTFWVRKRPMCYIYACS